MDSLFSSGFHLPLNARDLVNKPPLYFLWVQDAFTFVTGSLWTVAYVLYISQAYKDRSYGMPIVAL
jgi:paspaline synthase